MIETGRAAQQLTLAQDEIRLMRLIHFQATVFAGIDLDHGRSSFSSLPHFSRITDAVLNSCLAHGKTRTIGKLRIPALVTCHLRPLQFGLHLPRFPPAIWLLMAHQT